MEHNKRRSSLSVGSSLREHCKDMKNLRKCLKEVDSFLQTKFKNPQAISLQTSRSESASNRQPWLLRLCCRQLGSAGKRSGTVPLREGGRPPTQSYATVFSAATTGVRPGAIRVEMSDSDQRRVGDVAILRNQEARTVRHIASLV